MARELTGWRAAHPKATLAELKQVVFAATGRLQARVLSDLAHTSGAADLAEPRLRSGQPSAWRRTMASRRSTGSAI